MPKDEELKIDLSDLSDLFGGDVSDVKESMERSERMATEVESLSAGEREALDTIERKAAEERTREEQSALEKLEAERALREREQEVERRYREMMEARERELEEKTRELESRLQQMQQTVAPAEPPSAPAPATPLAPASSSPVDFSAPMPPPFSGAAAEGIPPPTGFLGGAPLVPDLQKEEERIRIQRDQEFFLLYEEFRGLIALELMPLVGEKKTRTMLARTVDMAREKFPSVLKKADWDWDGNIILDGHLDNLRMQENKDALPPVLADDSIDTAFRFLLDLRLKAVDKGLGTGMRTKVRARLTQWVAERIEKTRRLGRDVKVLQRLRALIPS